MVSKAKALEHRAPKKLSAAILLALADLELVEQDPKYVVDMEDWHRPKGGRCAVCFAGSVMAKTFNLSDKSFVYPIDTCFTGDWFRVFSALNYVRNGNVIRALQTMNMNPDFYEWVLVGQGFVTYEQDPKLFKEQIYDLAIMLEVNGY